MDDYLIHSVMFRPDGLIEISFAQEHEDVTQAALLRTIVFEVSTFYEEVSELRSDLTDLIEEVMIFLRNPDVRAQRAAKLKERSLDEAPRSGFDLKDF